MKHRWIAAGSAAMTEEQALDWAGYEGTGVTKTGLELFTADVFCAACDRTMGDVGDECPGPPHPSLFPHRWRVLTTMMLTDEEAESLFLDRPDALGNALPQALNVYCVLCGCEFDPAELNCAERSQILGAESRISDEDLERLLHGTEEADSYDWESIQVIGHDTWMALGSADFPRESAKKVISEMGEEIVNQNLTLPFCYHRTGSDAALPVEISKDRQTGETIAVRVCWTDDVDDVNGTWEAMGQFESGSKGRAWDPLHHLNEGGYEFPIQPGLYACQIFILDGDVLAIRAVHVPAESAER